MPSRSASSCFHGAQSRRSGSRFGNVQPLPSDRHTSSAYGATIATANRIAAIRSVQTGEWEASRSGIAPPPQEQQQAGAGQQQVCHGERERFRTLVQIELAEVTLCEEGEHLR